MPGFSSTNALNPGSADDILSKSLDKLLNTSNGSSVDSNLKSAHHSSLLTCSLKFKVSEQVNNTSFSNLSERYGSLQNGSSSPQIPIPSPKKSKHEKKVKHNDGIPEPKITICETNNFPLEWPRSCPVGSGLRNLGNSCFMNSVLQCLTYLPPLYNALVERNHAGTCSYKGFCSICEIQKHVSRAFKCSGSAISPTFFFNNLSKIGHFIKFKQEDAHEFLRYLLSHMEKCAVESFKAKNSITVDAASSRTTAINNIFGGYCRSQVVCLKCKETSNTFDPFMDIMVDIKHADTLDGAMSKFIKPEMLDGDNAYQCTKCKNRVPAQKRVTLHRMPLVCTFHLKRFQFHNAFGSKIGKWIRFPERLNLRPYMSESKGSPEMYMLRGIVVHLGHSMQSGHYCAYIRNCKGNFYCMNDDSVSFVDKNKVFSQNAYMLFYTRIPQPKDTAQTTQISGNKSWLKKEVSNKIMKENAVQQTKNLLPALKTNAVASASATTASANAPTNSAQKQPHQDKPPSQPKIVIKIKNGRVNNNTDSKTTMKSKSGLVPYAEDSDNNSDQDNGVKLINGNHIPKLVQNGHVGEPLKKVTTPLNVNTALPTVPLFKKVPSTFSPTRVNPPGTWAVTENKNQEPSLASSSSSTTSFNSTVDNWTVTGHEADGPSVDKRSFLGWTVANSPVRQSVPKNSAVQSCEPHEEVVKESDCKADDKSVKTVSDLAALESSADSDSSCEFEWVEKTKETIEEERRKSNENLNQDNSSPSNDHHNASSHSHRSHYVNGHSTASNHSIHDKLKDRSYADLYSGSLHGYGSSVKAWNGGVSEVNMQVEREKRMKRLAIDDYDQEYDRGKTKKIRRSDGDDRNYKFTKSFKSDYDNQRFERNCFKKYRSDYKYDRHNRSLSNHDRHHHNHSFHGKYNSHHRENNHFRRHSFHSNNSYKWNDRR